MGQGTQMNRERRGGSVNHPFWLGNSVQPEIIENIGEIKRPWMSE